MLQPSRQAFPLLAGHAATGGRVCGAQSFLVEQRAAVMIADPCDAQYLGAADPNLVDKLLGAANDLAVRGMVELAGDYARATMDCWRKPRRFIQPKIAPWKSCTPSTPSSGPREPAFEIGKRSTPLLPSSAPPCRPTRATVTSQRSRQHPVQPRPLQDQQQSPRSAAHAKHGSAPRRRTDAA